jgi:3-oxoadipate enol-lactonase
MAYVSNPIDGTKLYYEIHGHDDTRPVLMLLRGLGGNCQGWGTHLASLTRYCRCITMDHRGAGYSDKPDVPYDNQLYASDIKCVIDACKVERFTLLGVSMGGFIAQEYYHQYPHTIEGLILACTGTGYSDPAYIHPTSEVKRLQEIDRATADPRELVPQLMHAFWHPSYISKHPDLPEILLRAGEKISQPPHAYHRQYDSLSSSPWLSPRLGNIKVPTLVIHGDDDKVAPTPNAHYLASKIPDADLVIVPDSGHMFFIEKLEQFVGAVEHFLHKKVWKLTTTPDAVESVTTKEQDAQSQNGFAGG